MANDTVPASPTVRAEKGVSHAMTNPSVVRIFKYFATVLVLIGLSVVIMVIMAVVLPAGGAPASASTAEERPAVARLVSAAVGISPPLARLEAGLRMVPLAPC